MDMKRKRGSVLGIVAVMAMVLFCTVSVTESSATDPADGRMEVEAYTDTALALSPGGWAADARASGSALAAGLEWSDGMLEGTIATPGAYAVELTDGGRTLTIRLIVSERPAVDGVGGDSFVDVVLVPGVAEGTVLFDADVTGPDGMDVSYDLDPLFRYDTDSGCVVLARDVTASDAGIHDASVDATHILKHAGLSGTATLHAKVMVATSPGGPEALAQLLPPSAPVTTVITPEGTTEVHRDLYASSMTDLMVESVSLDGDGRDVSLSLTAYGTTDAVVEWGDGTRSVLATGTDGMVATHTYDSEGTYAIAVQVSGPTGDGSAVAVYGTDTASSDGGDGIGIWTLLALYLVVMAVLVVLTFLGYVPVLIPIVVGFGGLALVLINGVFR